MRTEEEIRAKYQEGEHQDPRERCNIPSAQFEGWQDFLDDYLTYGRSEKEIREDIEEDSFDPVPNGSWHYGVIQAEKWVLNEEG